MSAIMNTKLDPIAFRRARSDPTLAWHQTRATSILRGYPGRDGRPLDAYGLSLEHCQDIIAWYERDPTNLI